MDQNAEKFANAAHPIQPELVAVSLAYTNRELIADQVLPRIPVGKSEFRYFKYSNSENFTVPDTRVGRKGRPNEVDFTATDTPGFTQDYGLDDVVPQSDIEQAPPGHDPVGKAVEGLTNLVQLDREVRVANLVFNANNYSASQKATLSGTNQFSDYTNSNPLTAISDALDVPVMRPNIAVFGATGWTKTRMHPKLVEAYFGSTRSGGQLTRAQFAELFELEEVLVGSAFVNTAKKGQAVTMSRPWGKHLALLRRDRNATTRSGVTFGFTAEFNGRVAWSNFEPETGLRGATRVRVGESVSETLMANDLGYFFTNIIA